MKQELRKTKIKVLSEEHNKYIQEAVFAAGGEWMHSGEFYRKGVNFIFLNDSLGMTLCDNAVFFQEHDYKEIYLTLIPTKGYVHSELMTKYAEDAQTHAEPWKLWQFKVKDGVWCDCPRNPHWRVTTEYRRKPKTNIVNGVEIPDLRIEPKCGDQYWYPHPSTKLLCGWEVFRDNVQDSYRKENKLCYENTEAGKQAAILHAKAMLGFA